MTNNQSIDVNALAMAITNAVLLALQGDVPAPKTSARVSTKAPIARKATKVKMAKSPENRQINWESRSLRPHACVKCDEQCDCGRDSSDCDWCNECVTYKAQARKATKVKTAKSEERITDLSQMPLDALINRACAEAACAQAINGKRIALVPNDLRVLITRPTNAAIKMFCRDKANGVSITDASAMIVAKYEAANGKGSAKRLLAQFA